jgi:hypothetical protein
VSCTLFQPSGNPRLLGCERCGRLQPAHDYLKPRKPHLERYLTVLAARSAGLSDDRGLRVFADHRALPGGLRPRTSDEWDREVAEELADAGNYLVWALLEDLVGYWAGEAEATTRFERRLRALRRVVEAWTDLHTDAH